MFRIVKSLVPVPTIVDRHILTVVEKGVAMRTVVTMLILVSFMFVQSACSIYKASTQPPPADLAGIGIGTPRMEVIQRLGPPKFSETDPQGRKEDSFEFQSGMGSGSKLRIILYIAGDLFTLGLAELIFWPMELTVMESATCNAYASYDSSQKVETWKLSQKSGVQGC
jgi:hypothetical protein